MARRRPTPRRTLGLERLEAREVLSSTAVAGDALSQLMLERLNAARMNPAAVASGYTTGLDDATKFTASLYGLDLNAAKNDIANSAPQQPLAWSDQLASAALQHSQDMSAHGFQDHKGSDGSDPATRAHRNGYGDGPTAENAFAYAESVDNAMDAFMADWGPANGGHRHNILQPGTPADQSYREVGIGLVNSSGNGVGPLVVTQDFGRVNGSKPYLLGVAYNDANHNGQYDLNEGQGGVDVQVTNLANGASQDVKTAAPGGWQLPVDPGTYRVTGRFDGHVVKSQDVTVTDQNQKIDFVTSNAPAPEPPPVVVVSGLGNGGSNQGNPSNPPASPRVVSVSVAPSSGQAANTAPASTPTALPVFPNDPGQPSTPAPAPTPAPSPAPTPTPADPPASTLAAQEVQAPTPTPAPTPQPDPAPEAANPAPTADPAPAVSTTPNPSATDSVLAELLGAQVVSVSSWPAGH